MSPAGRRPARGEGTLSRPFPWAEALAFGLGVLRWPPAAFWSATPRELAAAAGRRGGPGGEPPDRAVLGELLARFPD
ncbi:rcc01693 family protein [uncultured Alsobacter sp.]|uniref:rcc01693 family protein n=1 Tax=uncultured Alsobacter sp. TaxID=1748258 RepID=UPI0025D0F7B8|nr:rcc01693 family protein [uncultured Alsobacter sp.]